MGVAKDNRDRTGDFEIVERKESRASITRTGKGSD